MYAFADCNDPPVADLAGGPLAAPAAAALARWSIGQPQKVTRCHAARSSPTPTELISVGVHAEGHLYAVARPHVATADSPFPDEDGSRDPWQGADLIEDVLAGAREGVLMGFRRRTRRRALIAGAAIAHHRDRTYSDQQAEDEPPAEDDQGQGEAQYAPPPADPADQIEHLAQLHASGALTDAEFTAAKAQALGS